MVRGSSLLAGLVAFWLGTHAAFGQSILEQLEKKVRDGLELNSPQNTNRADNSSGTTPNQSQDSQGELPPPVRKSPPPDPTPRSSASPGSSILEPQNLPPADPKPAAGDPDQSSYLGLEAESLIGGGIGARIVRVTENSPAWRAGFKVNDVVLAIDGYAITNLDTMVDRLALRKPGETIKFLLLRSGRNIELTAVLQNAAVAQRVQGFDGLPLPSAGAGSASLSSPAWMGVAVADLSSAFRTQFGLRAFRAAAVTNVTKGSPADLVGIQPGDAIVGADSQPVESARDLLDWMASKRPGDFVRVNVMRGVRATVLELTLVSDPKVKSAPSARSVLPDPFPESSSSFAQKPTPTESAGIPSVNGVPIDNTVPSPLASENSSEVQQLRGELRAAREQLTSLEQRVIELENLLSKQPK